MTTTTDQHDWIAEHHARRASLRTSLLAADYAASSARAIAAHVYRDLVKAGPGTFSELATRTGINDQQVWKRLSDLKNWGLIEPSGEDRPGPSGRLQTVWRVVELKRSAA